MGTPIVKLDLHGMYQDEAMKAIDRALKAADDSTYQIQLIHGYNRGTSLKDMIMDKYRHHPKVVRVKPVYNLGVTVLVLREL